MMKAITRTIVIFLVVFSSSLGVAAKVENKLDRTVLSPLGNIVVEHYYHDDGGKHTGEIWLTLKDKPAKRARLYIHHRHAEVLFSPDQAWLVINDYKGAEECDILLFKRKCQKVKNDLLSDYNCVEYDQIKQAAIMRKVVELFRKTNRTKKPLHLIAPFTEALVWDSADTSKGFLLSFESSIEWPGKEGVRYIGPWLCVFDVKSLTMSLNLNHINDNSFRRHVGFSRKMTSGTCGN